MRSISFALIGLFALSSGSAVATQMLGEDIKLAQHELYLSHHEQALAFANKALNEGEHMTRLAALNIKALTYIDLNDQTNAALAIDELAQECAVSRQQQAQEVDDLYSELLEMRFAAV
ncbi:hypothetical protein [Motilimonas pumila]|uniref:Uncharacterized protein n=1 Tax=Motilimonas pumila TaxID=2303987 RepID=A0A418YAE5_9GAMM|nr:hypothetical protein [Motilimonas pumila]RJG39488.1 hypothetical protein D1Z90_18110 [Motilimonas pumila]